MYKGHQIKGKTGAGREGGAQNVFEVTSVFVPQICYGCIPHVFQALRGAASVGTDAACSLLALAGD